MPKRAREEGEGDVDIGEAPTSINPYEVLSLKTDASAQEVKKAYRKAALQHHPDKASPDEKDAAHVKFQDIAFAYAILSDEARRKRYDITGSTEESLDEAGETFDWATFFRAQFFEMVTEDKINKFAEEYKGSDEETGAVLEAYTKHQGSMPKVYKNVMLSDQTEDEDRFRAIIDKAIADGEVGSFDKYTKETDKSRRGRIEQARKNKMRLAPEVEEVRKGIQEKEAKKAGKKSKGADSAGDLAALIQQRQAGRAEGFLANLEAKYAPKGKNGKKQAAMEEPPEEAFAKNAKNTGDDATEGARKSKRAKN